MVASGMMRSALVQMIIKVQSCDVQNLSFYTPQEAVVYCRHLLRLSVRLFL